MTEHPYNEVIRRHQMFMANLFQLAKNGEISPSTPPSAFHPLQQQQPRAPFHFSFPPGGTPPLFFNPVGHPFFSQQRFPTSFSSSFPSSPQISESPLDLSIPKQEQGENSSNVNNSSQLSSPAAAAVTRFPFPPTPFAPYNAFSTSSSSAHTPTITYDPQQPYRRHRSPKPLNHIKRPMNAFMIWSREKRKEHLKEFPNKHNTVISKELGSIWQSMSAEEKRPFFDEQQRLQELHMQQYPDYRYRPRPKRPRIEDEKIMVEYKKFKHQSNEFMNETSSQSTQFSNEVFEGESVGGLFDSKSQELELTSTDNSQENKPESTNDSQELDLSPPLFASSDFNDCGETFEQF